MDKIPQDSDREIYPSGSKFHFIFFRDNKCHFANVGRQRGIYFFAAKIRSSGKDG